MTATAALLIVFRSSMERPAAKPCLGRNESSDVEPPLAPCVRQDAQKQGRREQWDETRERQ